VTVTIRALCFTLLLSALSFRASGEEFTNAIRAFLQRRVEVEKRDVSVVIGVVDENGSRVVNCGRMDNGTGQEVNGDTLFELGSITKTFTALLLQDMVERGEMKLADPVALNLPQSVRMPTRNGKEMTLLQLATHTSGLPLLPYNLDPKRADNPYADYTVEKLYAFLSSYQPIDDPGTKYEYSELGMELLGHVISLKAGTNYESLVVDRICRPLKMDSTRVVLSPELKSRLATGHDELGNSVPGLDFQTLAGGSGLHSTANDLLKYLSAILGLTPSSLTPLMEKTHAVRFQSMPKGVKMALGWAIIHYPEGRKFFMHGGATPGYTAFLIFDKARRRGVVILSSSNDLGDTGYLGQLLLESEWQPDRRPEPAGIGRMDYGSYAGEYQLSPNIALGMLTLRALLVNVTKTAIGIAAGVCVAAALFVVLLIVLLKRVTFFRRLWTRLVLRWRAFSVRTRRIILCGAVLAGGSLAVLAPLVAAHLVCAFAHPVVNVRREDDRLFVQGTGSSHVASKVPLPHITGELWPESETRFFERMSGIPLTFSRNTGGKVIHVAAPLFGATLSFLKISDQAPEPPKPPVAIKLDAKLCDACVGQYEFAPDDLFPDGIRLTISRQGDRLAGQASDKNGNWGAFDIYPESETKFFFTMTVVGVQLTFIKNDKGEVTSVNRHIAWLPDCAGKKLKSN
jgi:CubicO group peptidase (beta-lactamase class C family)